MNQLTIYTHRQEIIELNTKVRLGCSKTVVWLKNGLVDVKRFGGCKTAVLVAEKRYGCLKTVWLLERMCLLKNNLVAGKRRFGF